MGLFKKKNRGAGKDPQKLYDMAFWRERDPKRRRQLYYDAIEAAVWGEKDKYVIRDALNQLLLDGELNREIPKILKLAENLDQDDRQDFTSAVKELQSYGIDNVPPSRDAMQDFLLDAAKRGSNAAARYGWEVYGSRTYRLNPRKDEFFEARALAGLRGDSVCLMFQLASANNISNKTFTGRENQYKFWEEFSDNLYNKKLPLPPFSESLPRWQKAVRLDREAKEAMDKKLIDEWNRLCRRRDAAWEHIDDLEVYALRDEGRTLDEIQEELEIVCDWLLARERIYRFQQDHKELSLEGKKEYYPLFPYKPGSPMPQWKWPDWPQEAESLFSRARDMEHVGLDYKKIVSLYKEAAEMGHGGAMYYLESLRTFWSGAGSDTRGYRTEDILKAGWPLVGSWRWPEVDKDNVVGVIELTRQGDMDGLRHLTELMMVRYRECRDDPEDAQRQARTDARITLSLQMDYNRILAEMGDCEAAFRLVWLYFECRDVPEFDLYLSFKQQHSQENLFAMNRGLGCYVALFKEGIFGTNEEQCLTLAKRAEQLGFTGAVEEYRNYAKQRAEMDALQERQRRQARQAAYEQARREAVARGMEEYRRTLDWAERDISILSGGFGGTREEDFLRGDISTQQYARERFIRGELEDSRQRKLEEDFDYSHRYDEDD